MHTTIRKRVVLPIAITLNLLIKERRVMRRSNMLMEYPLINSFFGRLVPHGIHEYYISIIDI